MKDESCEHSVSFLWKHLPLKPQILENCSGKNKWIQFPKQFRKTNQKLGTTKLPFQASQVI